MQKAFRDKKIAVSPFPKDQGSSIVPVIIVGVVGIVLGFLSSAWI